MAPDGRHEIDINQRRVRDEQIEISATFGSPHSLKSAYSDQETNKLDSFAAVTSGNSYFIRAKTTN